MIHISEEEFEDLVRQSVESIPDRFRSHLNNVAFMVADEPSSGQRRSNKKLHTGEEVLLGLYEGIPLPARNDGYNGVMPDVITIFRHAHEIVCQNQAELAAQVHETVWHEVAHYFGLDHGQIDALEAGV